MQKIYCGSRMILMLLSFVLVFNANGQNIKSYSNEFLSIGVGARAHGMGGAVVATTNDVNSGYWNPAGIAAMDAPFQLGAMHAEWFAGIVKYDHISMMKRLNADKSSYAGISIIRMGVDDIPNTLQLREPDGSINYDNITTFAVADYAIMGHYAQKLGTSNWLVGGNVKVIHRSLGSFSKAWGFGLDLGLQYRGENFYFGVMARDVTSTYNAWTHTISEADRKVLIETGNNIPANSVEITLPSVIPGIGWNFDLGQNYSLLAALDMKITFDGQRNVLISNSAFNIDPGFGLEAYYKNIVGIRAGINNAQRFIDNFGENAVERFNVQPNMGLALKISNFYIDYAIANLGNNSVGQLSHIFSLKIDIFPKDKNNNL